ncbi:MAG: AbrB/MazE/SpoVT family DNA-binding domain-containing protein [Bacillota bacterium]
MEIRKIFRAGNSFVISLPQKILQEMKLEEGSQVALTVNAGKREIVIKPVVNTAMTQITGDFARQVEAFLDEYAGVLKDLKNETPDR